MCTSTATGIYPYRQDDETHRSVRRQAQLAFLSEKQEMHTHAHCIMYLLVAHPIIFRFVISQIRGARGGGGLMREPFLRTSHALDFDTRNTKGGAHHSASFSLVALPRRQTALILVPFLNCLRSCIISTSSSCAFRSIVP